MSSAARITGASIAPLGAENAPKTTAKANGANSGASFAELLRARQGIASEAGGSPSIKFSAHAQTRIESRKIAFSASHLDRLQTAVQNAAGKGAKDALVLMDNLAMVVSIPNRTVVTVVDKDNLQQNVFTNIDSAVIA